jgi:hypothetical protein
VRKEIPEPQEADPRRVREPHPREDVRGGTSEKKGPNLPHIDRGKADLNLGESEPVGSTRRVFQSLESVLRNERSGTLHGQPARAGRRRIAFSALKKQDHSPQGLHALHRDARIVRRKLRLLRGKERWMSSHDDERRDRVPAVALEGSDGERIVDRCARCRAVESKARNVRFPGVDPDGSHLGYRSTNRLLGAVEKSARDIGAIATQAKSLSHDMGVEAPNGAVAVRRDKTMASR